MEKKIDLKILTKKALIYRVIVIIIQVIFTYLFIGEFWKSVNISWSWNILNLFLFMIFCYFFDKRQSPYKEEDGDE